MPVATKAHDPEPGVACGHLTRRTSEVTAVVVFDPGASSLRIASLTVLDRLVVCLSRAGAHRIILISTTPPSLARSTELEVKVEHADRLPPLPGRVLIAAGNVLVTAADLQRVIASGGRLATGAGELLPVGMVDELGTDWPSRLDGAPEVKADGFVARVTVDSAAMIEKAYWRSLTSSSDGWVDRHFNRPVGRLLSKRLVATPITPNQVSVVATLVGLVAAWLFAVGSAPAALAGALVLQVSAILDCIDGDLARALFKQSPLGKWLDIVGDQVVHVAVFLGIGIGLGRSGSDAPVLVLGGVAAVGVICSFGVVLRVLLHPGLRGHNRLQRLIDATTNRDFSVLLIGFAWFEVLDWFLWLAAVGSHVFWLAAAGLQFQENRRVQDHAEGT